MVLEAGMEMGVVGVEVEVEVAMDLQVETGMEFEVDVGVAEMDLGAGMGREVVLEVLMGREVGWVDSATSVCWKK
jgi:hypothetical protein